MTFHVPENQTVSFSVYKQALAENGVSSKAMRKFAEEVTAAFDGGMPPELAADVIVDYFVRSIKNDLDLQGCSDREFHEHYIQLTPPKPKPIEDLGSPLRLAKKVVRL